MHYLCKLISFCYVLSINAIQPNFCVNCKYFRYHFFSGKKFGKCALFPIIDPKNEEAQTRRNLFIKIKEQRDLYRMNYNIKINRTIINIQK